MPFMWRIGAEMVGIVEKLMALWPGLALSFGNAVWGEIPAAARKWVLGWRLDHIRARGGNMKLVRWFQCLDGEGFYVSVLLNFPTTPED
jgi:hypothetical protein